MQSGENVRETNPKDVNSEEESQSIVKQNHQESSCSLSNNVPEPPMSIASPNPMEVQYVPKIQIPCGNHDIKAKSQTVPQLSMDRTDNRDYVPRENASDMRSYQERLKTYANWPIPAILKPEVLAKNGFYYLNRGDEVRCAFCKVEIMKWEPGDDPAVDHLKWAPQCPFLRQLASGSGAAPAPADGRDECGSRAPPPASPSSPAAPASLPRMAGPVNPNYSTYTSRLASFRDWPLSMRQKPRDLADAGFFYTGQGDKTKCFYCDGGLKDWEDDDVPWEQHARWFDRCAYVQLVKGRDYVQKVMTEACMIRTTEKEKPKEPEVTPEANGEAEKSDTENDEKLCKICYEGERNVVFVPCGHVVACAKCALSTDKCPMCRRTFANAVRLYYS